MMVEGLQGEEGGLKQIRPHDADVKNFSQDTEAPNITS